jgi:tripartite-type tricarboxylate transporter receptor subunit TctC
MFDNLPASIEHIKAGKMRPLGVTTAKRSDILPDVPTVAETVPGYESSGMFGVSAPKGTPPAIIAILNREINAGLADPKVRTRLIEMGGIILSTTPEEFGKVVAEETEKWEKAVRFSGASMEY